MSAGYRRIVIGRDTRISGPWIERTLAAGIRAGGGKAVSVGVITTPGISFLSRTQGFDAGVAISASHNPFHDNGIKIFEASGLKLSDADEARLEQLIEADTSSLPDPVEQPDASPQAVSSFDREQVAKYIQFLVQTSSNGSLRGTRVALDCANGAAFAIAEEALGRLGAELLPIENRPDGRNINSNCGALHPQGLAEIVRRQRADVGLAFDGDADRLVLVDENGSVRDGDYVLYALGRHLVREGRLPTATIVTTVMANLGLEVALRREGLQLERTRVGDRYVLEAMLKGGHELGGEQSGHTILKSRSISGDGILTGIQILNVMSLNQAPLSRLCQGLEKFPQVLLNVKVGKKPDFAQIPSIRAAIDSSRSRLGPDARVLIRYSGTEPLARIMVEGPDQALIEDAANAIADCFRAELGAAEEHA